MRPVKVSVNAVADSQWIPVDYTGLAFALGLAVIPNSTATTTFTVQHTLDELDWTYANPVTISRSGTTATVTDAGVLNLGHGLSTGDNVIIKGSGSTNLDTTVVASSAGQGDLGVDVTVTGYNTYTYTVANAGATTDGGYAKALKLRVFPHAVIVGATAKTDGNYAFPIRATRLKVTALTGTNAFVDYLVLQGRSA